MIDLLKNYKQLHNASGYVGSIRYILAKKKLDTLFVKWLSSNRETVNRLIQKAEAEQLKPSEYPNPLFSHHRVPMQNSQNLTASSVNFNNTITPPRNINENAKNKQLNETHGANYLVQSAFISKPVQQVSSAQIPQFYFPGGKPLDPITETSYRSSINTIIGNKTELNIEIISSLVVNVVGLPIYFTRELIKKTKTDPTANKITRNQFNKIWKELQTMEIQRRAFYLMSSHPRKKYLTIDDFKVLFKEILDIHPGLQFLKQTPDFQQWYSICVIHRMFFMANRKGDFNMSFRQFKRSNILKSLLDIESQADINRNQDFFSYQDFYVIYVKFWQLDYDHDFLLTKQQLSKYSGYTFPRKVIERIFSQDVKKFTQKDKMGFGDFVWLILCVEDKTTEQSIEYWFKIMDLDGNGIITGYELEEFYEEQSKRLAYMDNSVEFNFENIICQMVDIFKPQVNIQFKLQDFLKKKQQSSIFINMLTDLNKLVSFEQRDAYEQRNSKVQNPNWTEWDRFVKPQYKRVQNSPDNDNGGEVINWQNDD